MKNYLLRQMLKRRPDPFREALLGASFGLVAVCARLFLYPVLGLGVPYIAFFPVILVTSLLFDIAGAAACLAVTSLGAAIIVMRPPMDHPSSVGPMLALPISTLSAAAIIWVALTLRRALTDLHVREQHERLLVGELQHRVKNTLSIVQAIAAQTARGRSDVASFTRVFTERLVALGAAHNLLSLSAWAPITMLQLAEKTLSPFAQHGAERLRLSGEELLLPPDHVVSLALCLHELATNATKYGALSDPTGWVDLTWSAAKQPHGKRVRLSWREHDGPPVSPTEREGFGSKILRAGLGGRARSKTTLDLKPDGLQWTVSFDVADDEIGPARKIPPAADDE